MIATGKHNRIGKAISKHYRCFLYTAAHIPPSISTSDLKDKRLVIVGTGWGGISFFRAIDPSMFKSVTIVSPRNYFLFTPLLPSVAVGTTEPRYVS